MSFSRFRWRVARQIFRLLNTFYYFRHRASVLPVSVMMYQRFSRVYSANFGDGLNFPVLSFLSGKKVVNLPSTLLSPGRHTHYAAIGSIAAFPILSSRSVIWGSGVMSSDATLAAPPAEVHAVRGPLTARWYRSHGVDCPDVFGDPALLLPMLYRPRPSRVRYRLGLIPHIRDFSLPVVQEFVREHPDVCLIDLHHYEHYTDVVDLIGACAFVASSSLHGLIVADAYGIPNVWCRFSDRIGGGDFKFHDYFLGVGRPIPEVLDFRSAPLSFDALEQAVRAYTPIHFDPVPLLRSCPFLRADFPLSPHT